MPVALSCSGCAVQLQAPDNCVGKQVKCPKCGAVVAVPLPKAIPLPTAVPVLTMPKADGQTPGFTWTPQRIWLATGIGGGSLLLILIVLVVALSSSGPRSVPEGNTSEPGLKAPAEKKKGTITEADSRGKLKTTLDSWVFGDSLAKFESNHPDIHFGDLDRVQSLVLMRYEIGASRPFGVGCFDFAVTMSFQSEAGTEIRRSAKYTVMPPGDDGKWTILGGS